MKKLLFSFVFFSFSSLTYAGGPYTCFTQSKSFPFTATNDVELLAKQAAVKACQADFRTANGECQSEVYCQPSTTSLTDTDAACKTFSHGYSFTDQGKDELTVKAATIRKCQASSFSWNDECLKNATCEIRSSAGQAYTCLTESTSFLFPAKGPDLATTQTLAIQACQKHPGAVNDDCISKLQCEGIPITTSASKWSCLTESHSNPFTASGSDHFEALAKVYEACKKFPSTTDGECRANIKCQIDWSAYLNWSLYN